MSKIGTPERIVIAVPEPGLDDPEEHPSKTEPVKEPVRIPSKPAPQKEPEKVPA